MRSTKASATCTHCAQGRYDQGCQIRHLLLVWQHKLTTAAFNMATSGSISPALTLFCSSLQAKRTHVGPIILTHVQQLKHTYLQLVTLANSATCKLLPGSPSNVHLSNPSVVSGAPIQLRVSCRSVCTLDVTVAVVTRPCKPVGLQRYDTCYRPTSEGHWYCCCEDNLSQTAANRSTRSTSASSLPSSHYGDCCVA